MSTAELWGLFLTAGAAIVGWVATLYTLVGKVGALVDQVDSMREDLHELTRDVAKVNTDRIERAESEIEKLRDWRHNLETYGLMKMTREYWEKG